METSLGLPGRGPTPGVCIMPRRPCSDSAPLRWKPGLRAHLCSQELSGSWMGLGEGCRARDECIGQGYVPTQRSDSPSCPLVGGLEGTAEPCAGGISQAEAPGASGLEQGLLWLAEAGGAGQAPVASRRDRTGHEWQEEGASGPPGGWHHSDLTDLSPDLSVTWYKKSYHRCARVTRSLLLSFPKLLSWVR